MIVISRFVFTVFFAGFCSTSALHAGDSKAQEELEPREKRTRVSYETAPEETKEIRCEDESQIQDCPICRERSCDQTLRCQHSFCSPCIKGVAGRYCSGYWLLACPLCRQEDVRPEAKNVALCDSRSYFTKGRLKRQIREEKLPRKSISDYQKAPNAKKPQVLDTDPYLPLHCLIEKNNKDAQEFRSQGQPVASYAAFMEANKNLKRCKISKANPKLLKIASWTKAQTGFLLTGLDQKSAIPFLQEGVANFQNLVDFEKAKENRNEELLFLQESDLAVSNLHLLTELSKYGLVDAQKFSDEFEEIRKILEQKQSLSSWAQWHRGYAVHLWAMGSLDKALASAIRSVELAIESGKGGFEVCIDTLIHILADLAEQEKRKGGAVSVEFLVSNKAQQCFGVIRHVRERACIAEDTYEVAHLLVNLGRLAESFELYHYAHAFYERAGLAMRKLEAEFEHQKAWFEDLPEEFHYKLPPYVEFAENRARELAIQLQRNRYNQIIDPGLAQIFEGIYAMPH